MQYSEANIQVKLCSQVNIKISSTGKLAFTQKLYKKANFQKSSTGKLTFNKQTFQPRSQKVILLEINFCSIF